MSNDMFFEFDLSDPDNLPSGMEDLGDQMDPLSAFEEFEPALKEVVFVGVEDVEGEELNHFRLTMETAKLASLEEVPAGSGLPKTVDYDLWFDDGFLMRQMQMTMDMMMSVNVEAKLYDWGQPVEIEAPPADQISESGMGGSGG